MDFYHRGGISYYQDHYNMPTSRAEQGVYPPNNVKVVKRSIPINMNTLKIDSLILQDRNAR